VEFTNTVTTAMGGRTSPSPCTIARKAIQ